MRVKDIHTHTHRQTHTHTHDDYRMPRGSAHRGIINNRRRGRYICNELTCDNACTCMKWNSTYPPKALTGGGVLLDGDCGGDHCYCCVCQEVQVYDKLLLLATLYIILLLVKMSVSDSQTWYCMHISLLWKCQFFLFLTAKSNGKPLRSTKVERWLPVTQCHRWLIKKTVMQPWSNQHKMMLVHKRV